MRSIQNVTLGLLLVICVASTVLAQSPAAGSSAAQDSDVLRGIVPEKFVDQRPRKSVRPSTRPKYRPATSAAVATEKTQSATAGVARYAQLGLTIWQLRKSTTGDNAARLPVADTAGASDWTPIRVEAGKPLAVGDLVRLSIESSVAGYLYVIDRGQYQDGTLSEPSLIFPTTRTRGGDNSVKPGRLIELPAQNDRPNYFRLKSSRGELVAELLTIIVANEPIPGLAEEIGSRPLALNKEQLAKWQIAWNARVEHFELEGGEGKAWTRAEQEAGADETRELTQDDAPPQTIFRVARRPDAPLLVNVELRISPAVVNK